MYFDQQTFVSRVRLRWEVRSNEARRTETGGRREAHCDEENAGNTRNAPLYNNDGWVLKAVEKIYFDQSNSITRMHLSLITFGKYQQDAFPSWSRIFAVNIIVQFNIFYFSPNYLSKDFGYAIKYNLYITIVI